MRTQSEAQAIQVQFFKREINYLAHHVSKEGVKPSKENLKAVAEFSPPKTYMEIWAFWGLVGHYRQFIKGFACVAQLLHEHLSGEGSSKKNEWVTLTREVQDAFETLKKACLEAPVLAFANFDKPFLLETDASKLQLGVVLLQKQTDGPYHPVAYASWSLTVHGYNYHSTKQEFLALKWAIVEQFQEYLLWKLFVIKTDNNLLTYIMTTPNLDATWHHWVESLMRFTFGIEYQKGQDNVAANALSGVTSKLDEDKMKSILDRVAMGTTGRTKAQDPVVVEADEEIHKHIWETAVQAGAAHTWVSLHVTDWLATQQEHQILWAVIKYISNWKVQDLKHLIGDDANTEEGTAVLRVQKKVTLIQGAPYHCCTLAGKLEEVLQFVVPMAHWVAAMNTCHQDAGHQGQQWILYLLQDQFWWPIMTTQMQNAIDNCE